MAVWRIIDPLFAGKMNRYKGIEGKNIAIAMIQAAKKQSQKVNLYNWNEINQLLLARGVPD
ncbi:hypothetical protein I8J29_09265 [Paenibacillus sp. MWE-103]|uniref:Uncharacterized protein n=1 Tax=Paenibacillus artemisiicola TaxID=1172618 RepID=A0ABS3W7U1_9BACL|nr:hypothetical protein [Paenibacillus artemisiicola]MBO7744382.1 hypothetical protein [Paenibacillus artemisiicola]